MKWLVEAVDGGFGLHHSVHFLPIYLLDALMLNSLIPLVIQIGAM